MKPQHITDREFDLVDYDFDAADKLWNKYVKLSVDEADVCAALNAQWQLVKDDLVGDVDNPERPASNAEHDEFHQMMACIKDVRDMKQQTIISYGAVVFKSKYAHKVR